MAKKTLRERFEEKADRSGGPDACHEWTGCRHPDWGYGHIKVEGKVLVASRVAWFLEYRVWPKKQVLHSCDNPPCVNIKHLEDGTQKTNVEQMIQRGRRYTRLTADQLRSAMERASKGESLRSIGRSFGVRHQTIANSLERAGSR